MDETELIGSLQSQVSTTLSVPVRTNALDDERPVPSIIIDDWDSEDLNHHNSAFAGEETKNQEYERYLNFDWRTRVEFLVRHSDEVDVSRLKEDLKHKLRIWSENPQTFDTDVKDVILRAGGNPRNTFTEPKEAELMISVVFKGDHEVVLGPEDTQYDTIDDVKNDFTFNPN